MAVPVGSAYPEPGSQAATATSSTRIPGTSRATSSGPTTAVGIPSACCAATFARRAVRLGPADELQEPGLDEAAVARARPGPPTR